MGTLWTCRIKRGTYDIHVGKITTLYIHYIHIYIYIYIHYIYIIYTLYIQYIYIIYTLYIQYIYTLYIHYIHIIYTLYIHYIYIIYTLYIYIYIYIYIIYTYIYILYIYIIYTLYIQYIYNIYIIDVSQENHHSTQVARPRTATSCRWASARNTWSACTMSWRGSWSWRRKVRMLRMRRVSPCGRCWTSTGMDECY